MKQFILFISLLVSIPALSQIVSIDTVPPVKFIEKDIIGKWKDENSTISFFQNGNYNIVYDDGNSSKGIWTITKKRELIFELPRISISTTYSLLYYTPSLMRYKESDGKDNTIWNAKKIANFSTSSEKMYSPAKTGSLKIAVALADSVGMDAATCELLKDDEIISSVTIHGPQASLIKNIPAGNYLLKISSVGFRSEYMENIVINPDDTTSITTVFPGPCKFIYPEKYKPLCPYNHRSNIVRIVYGLPSEESIEDAKKGLIYLGGCVLTGCDPKYYCTKHNIEF